MARCRQGDTAAFDYLMNRYQDRIYDLACVILRDEQEAKDVVQETFLRAYQRLDGYRGEASLETWLVAIAANYCRDLLRRRRARQTLSLETLTPRWLRRLAGRNPQPEAEAARNQQRREIWALVDELDERLRLVLILRYRYELSCAEIGEALGIATTTVYGRLTEARRRLSDLMEEEMGHR
jgi:RNA polymerase sigma-70 factor, ECF subfamily